MPLSRQNVNEKVLHAKGEKKGEKVMTKGARLTRA